MYAKNDDDDDDDDDNIQGLLLVCSTIVWVANHLRKVLSGYKLQTVLTIVKVLRAEPRGIDILNIFDGTNMHGISNQEHAPGVKHQV